MMPEEQELNDEFEVDPDPRSKTYAKLELKSTSTSNPDRPRTLAAGWDKNTGTMTVVFRDRTWYNYYNVPEEIWDEFRGAPSKGVYLEESGLNNWDDKGPVNRDTMSPHKKNALDSVVEAAAREQDISGGLQFTGDTRRLSSVMKIYDDFINGMDNEGRPDRISDEE